jgi:hypothetical protein
VKVFLHTSQQYGRSPLCKRLCVIRLLLRVNVLLHTSQQYGRSPLCNRLCVIRLLFWVNAFLHTLHVYWCSLVCAWSCSFQVSCQKHKDYTLEYLLIGRTITLNSICKLHNFRIWKPAHSKQGNEYAHTTKYWKFQLRALNGNIICMDYCWGPRTFMVYYSNHKNIGVRTQTYGKFQFTVSTKYRDRLLYLERGGL